MADTTGADAGRVPVAPAGLLDRSAASVGAAAAGIVLCLLCTLYLALVRQINWDEFRYLSDIYNYQYGLLTDPLLTIHVHAFGWLTGIGGNEIDKIVVARMVMLALHLGSCACIYMITRRVASPPAALMAVLAFASFSFVTVHGAAFRFDPPTTFFLMAAVALIFCAPPRVVFAVLAGTALAVATLVSIKTVLYLPVLAAACFWRMSRAGSPRAAFQWCALVGASAAVAFALLYAWHVSTMPAAGLAEVSQSATEKAGQVFGAGRWFPRRSALEPALAQNPLFWIAAALGLAIAGRSALAGRGRDRLAWISLAALALILAVLAFYQNAFPYFYVFLLPAVCVLAGLAFDTMTGSRLLLPLLALALTGSALVNTERQRNLDHRDQRLIVATVHELFPQPVEYIDGVSMISSFHKLGAFLSSWGLRAYRDAGRPVLREMIIAENPAFLLADTPVLEDAVHPDPTIALEDGGLLTADVQTLRDNFIPHWGGLWLAGKNVPITLSTESRFEMLLPGLYTVEAEGGAAIDGVPYRDRATVDLAGGWHTARALAGGSGTLTLRIGDNLPVPAEPWPDEAGFHGF